MYNCAQNATQQHKSKKIDEVTKHRDKDRMITFQCKGWLHITISDNLEIALVKIDHCDDHIPYFPIDIPPEIENLVRENQNLSPTQVNEFLPFLAKYLLNSSIDSSGTWFFRRFPSLCLPEHLYILSGIQSLA